MCSLVSSDIDVSGAILSPTATVHANRQDLVETSLEGETVVLHTGKSLIYGLNTVGSRVWQMIAEPTSVPEICAVLCREFEVDPAECDQQVRSLLEHMLAEGLLAVEDTPPSVVATP